MLRASNVTVRAGGRALLDGVTLDFAPGELTALVGPNGAGKTTLLRCLDGELVPSAGRVALGDRALADWPRMALARARAVLPQESELNFPFSALDVALLGRIPHATGDAADRRIARRALALCDCAELAERDYPSLSGGEKQRVQTARVLAQLFDDGDGAHPSRHPRSLLSGGGDGVSDGDGEPVGDGDGDGETIGDGARARLTERGRGSDGERGRGSDGERGRGSYGRFLLLDEPASALDLRHQYQLLALLKTLARDGVGIITALHNLNLVAQFADRAVVIDRGLVVADGAPAEVFTEAMLSHVFGFEVSVGLHPDDATVPLLLPKLPPRRKFRHATAGC